MNEGIKTHCSLKHMMNCTHIPRQAKTILLLYSREIAQFSSKMTLSEAGPQSYKANGKLQHLDITHLLRMTTE